MFPSLPEKTFTARRPHRLAWSLMLCAALAACGGGDDAEETLAVTAAADTLTVNVGETGQLLANDRLGSMAATAGAAGNVSFTLTSGALPTGVAVSSAGAVSVDATAVPGAVALSYRLCEAANSSNCASANAQITIPAPPIVAVADSFNLVAGASADVLANDTLGGTPATAARVGVTATVAMPTGLSLANTGVISVDATAAPGSYAVGYRVCQTVAPTNCATATATVTVPALGSIAGRAVDAATGAGILNVRVSVGALSTLTDASGAFTLAGVTPGSRVTVIFSAPTHGETARIAALSVGGTTDVQARLVAVGSTTSVAVAAGGTATVPGSTARVVLAAGSVQRADGSLPTGNLQVRLTPIDPASDTSVMPGDFTTLVGAVAVPIESFGALDVRLSDDTGQTLNLRSGQSASLRIPVASRDPNPPATIPLFYFDNAAGRWVQEGTATLAGTAPNRYYEGTVTHFTVWNADRVADTVRVSGCVADANGVRVAGAHVYTDGVNYSGTSSAVADANGDFTVPMRVNSVATLVGLSLGQLSNTLSVGPYAVDTQLPNCLALGQNGAGITMKLTWGANPSDLDSHLYLPDGTEVYYNNEGALVAAPFANLDVDDTSSYGPEVVTITKLMVGTYKYAVRNYSGYSDGPMAQASARVELNVPGRAAELFTPPATGESTDTEYWLLFELDVDAQCNVVIRRQGSYSPVEPPAANSSTPVYCTR
jgi:hypothetical protein